MLEISQPSGNKPGELRDKAMLELFKKNIRKGSSERMSLNDYIKHMVYS